ncbi:MAG: hypothetical protein ACJ74O_16415 [Frankiaceae bacterium]
MTGRRVLDTVAQVQRDVGAMWTEPVEVTVAPRGTTGDAGAAVLHELVLLPSAARPRLVASAGSRAARAAAVARFSHSTGPAGRAARLAVAAAIRTGVADPLLRDRLRVVTRRGGHVALDGSDSLIAQLGEVFGTDVVVSMPVGAVRANRKPVLHVLAPGGRTLGFAKLALSPLAGRLVHAEAANLRALAGHGFRHLELPEVIHAGTWSGHPLLVMTALATPLRRYHPASRLPVEAMTELAAVGGTPILPLGESAWLAALREPAATPEDRSAERFAELLDRIRDRHGERPVRFGSWHGDWGPWNMVWAGDRVRLWDWERFASGVPHGFDALHYSLPQLPAGTTGAPRLRQLATAALAPLGTSAAADAPLVLALYVAALCARFLPDSRTEHGGQLRARVASLLDLLAALVDDAGAGRTVHDGHVAGRPAGAAQGRPGGRP